MVDFFISYNKADRGWAEWIAWVLEEDLGFTTVIQAWDFRGNFVLEMDKAAKEAERTVAVLSPDYFGSDFTPSEWAAAFARDPKSERGVLIPVRVRECELSGLLAQINYVDFVGRDEATAAELFRARVRGERLKPGRRPAFPGADRSAAARPAFPGPATSDARIWNVPHPRNPNFTGREGLLEELHRRLSSGEPAALVQALHGLGGVGKTQLATEYAYRHRGEYEIVWWVRAEEPATLVADCAALAAKLGLAEAEERDLSRVVAAVCAWLNGHSGWLLVFDDAESPQDLRPYLPPGGGRVVVTSRNPAWGAVARPLRVEVMAPDEAVAFLLRQGSSGDEAAARELAEELDRLPLALEHSRAYVEETGTTLRGYLDLFRQHRRELLADRRDGTDYPLAVAATWEAGFERAREREPAAADLMNLCAFLAPDPIPLDLLTAEVESLPESLARVVATPLTLDMAVVALRRYSLVQREDQRLTFHRLVQTVARNRLDKAERERWSAVAFELVVAAANLRSDPSRQWAFLLLPHLEVAASWTRRAGDKPLTFEARYLSAFLHLLDCVSTEARQIINSIGR